MRIFSSSAIVRAIAAALGAGLVYTLIAGMIDPGNQHFSAAILIGLTLGIHVYRRARQQQIST